MYDSVIESIIVLSAVALIFGITEFLSTRKWGENFKWRFKK